MRNRAANIFSGLENALVDVVMAFRQRSGNPARTRVLLGPESWVVTDRGGKQTKIPAGDRAQLAKLVGDADVEIELPLEQAFFRDLDPLPQESEPYISDIVRHQIERLVPWKADDVIYGHAVAHRDERLIVTLAAISRSIHADVLNALHEKRAHIVCRRSDPNLPPIVVGSSSDHSENRARIARMIRRALVVALLIVASGVAVTTLANGQMDDRIRELEQSVADTRRQLVAAAEARRTGEGEIRKLIDRRKNAPYLVLVLDALSQVIPDDTFLTELRLEGNVVRMVGLSRNVAGLVPLIETSRVLKDPVFFAATVRQQEEQRDRFHLEVRVATGAGK